MDRENLHALAAASGAQVVGSWGGSVTHVVCHVGEDGRAKRTAKYMHGILEVRPAALRGGPPAADVLCGAGRGFHAP